MTSLSQYQYDILGERVAFHLPNPQDHIQKHIIQHGNFYESEMLREIAPLIPDDGVVVDAGANIGNHTLFFAKLLKARVLSFEPNPATFDILERNVELNDVGSIVEAYPLGLGAQSAKGSIIDANNGNAGMAQVEISEEGSIDITTVDEMVGDLFVHLIKIDVEGMEADVLRGAALTIRRCRPYLIIEAGTADALTIIEKVVRPLGYVKTRVFNHTPTYLFKPSEITTGSTATERLPSPIRERLPTTRSIQAGMAALRGNEVALRAAIASILPQVDHLHVYLNGFDVAPQFIRDNPRISHHIDPDGSEFGDAGKFWGLGKLEDAIYFTCDDDIIYPADYVERLVSELALTGGKSIVTTHGTILVSPNDGYYAAGSRIVMHFQQALLRRRKVHVGGTGTCAFHSNTVKMGLSDFRAPNMADIWIAQYAHANNISIYAVPRPANWLKPLQASRKSIYEESSKSSGNSFDTSTAQDEILREMHPISLMNSDSRPSVFILDIAAASDIPAILSAAYFGVRDPVVFVISHNVGESMRQRLVAAGLNCEVHLLDTGAKLPDAYRNLLERAVTLGRVFVFSPGESAKREDIQDFDAWVEKRFH